MNLQRTPIAKNQTKMAENSVFEARYKVHDLFFFFSLLADCEWSDWLPCNTCYNKTSRKLLKQDTFSGKCDEDVEIKDCE